MNKTKARFGKGRCRPIYLYYITQLQCNTIQYNTVIYKKDMDFFHGFEHISGKENGWFIYFGI